LAPDPPLRGHAWVQRAYCAALCRGFSLRALVFMGFFLQIAGLLSQRSCCLVVVALRVVAGLVLQFCLGLLGTGPAEAAAGVLLLLHL
jgi:hypothetical protein